MSDQFIDEVTGSITIPPKNKMTGRVRIVGVGEGNLSASLTVAEFNNIRASGYIYSDEVVEDIAYPPRFGNQRKASLTIPYHDSIKGNIFITPKNRMAGLIEIIPPPKRTMILKPVKDSFIRSQAPTFNYGDSSSLLVGRNGSTNEIFRSFIEFDISEIPDDATIENAELYLFNNAPRDVDQQLGIYEVSNNWIEDSITWFNQPSVNSLVDIQSFGKDVTYKTFDVSRSVKKWYDGNTDNNGWSVKATNENSSQYEQFNSKDHSNNQPYLVVTYTDNTLYSFGRSSMESNLFVYSVGSSEVTGSLTIRGFDFDNTMPASIHVYNPLMMESTLTVNRPEVKSNITVRQSTEDDVESSITVRQSFAKEIESGGVINTPDRLGRLYVPYRDSISSNLTVRKMEHSDIPSGMSINTPDKYGSIYVPYREDLLSSIRVRDYSHSEVSSSMMISRPSMQGNLKVRVADTGSLFSNIVVNRIENRDIDSNIRVNRDALISNIQVVLSSNISSSITVRRSNNSEIESNLIVPHRTSISGHLEVVGANMIPSSLTVLSGNLRASIRIPAYEFHDIIGNMHVRGKWANEIRCSLTVGGEIVEEGYVFIL